MPDVYSHLHGIGFQLFQLFPIGRTDGAVDRVACKLHSTDAEWSQPNYSNWSAYVLQAAEQDNMSGQNTRGITK